MSLEEIYSSAGHLIRRLNQIAVGLFLDETESVGLTTVQYSTLYMICEVPGIDQAGLSSIAAFDKTTLVKVLDRLEEKKLIVRERSATDRRRQLLRATDAGRKTIKKVGPMIARSEARILAPLGAAERVKFMEMLTKVVRINNAFSRAPLNDETLENVAARESSRRSSAGAKKGRRRKA